ncbi:MAG: hypothetical protein GY804_01075 [Alphaproteobacteria bacterium]|nr:hypothetical protein [Alphaproteobacteria bacterium]
MMQEHLTLRGECRGFQTFLDYEEVKNPQTGLIELMPIDTKEKVPGTDTGWVKNTIQDALINYLAYKIGTNTNNQALDNLHTYQGATYGISATQEGEDGIAYHSTANNNLDNYFVTTLNAGGGVSDGYIEFYGYLDGPLTLAGLLHLGFNYEQANEAYEFLFASISISQVVAASRRYGHYWKITLS